MAGEEAAFFFLCRQGFMIVAQRWNESSLPGDIDLIAWQGDTLCFIEVKTRTSREVTTATFAVDRHKRRILRRLAGQYVRHLPGGHLAQDRPPMRFDIVTVYRIPGEKQDIRLIPAAFGWRESD
jgi:putative endonuclease